MLPIAPGRCAGHAGRAGRSPGGASTILGGSRSRARSGTSSATRRRASFVEAGWPDSGAFAYYGTADATPWFLVLLGAVGDPLAARRGARCGPRPSGSRDRLDAGGGLLRHSPGTWPGGLTQMGWRDTIDAAGDPGGGGYVRARRQQPGAAAGRRRHPGRRGRRAAGAVRAHGRSARGRAGSPTCARASERSLRARGHGARGGRRRRARARARSSAGCCGRTRLEDPAPGGGAPVRAGHPDGLRAADAGVDAPRASASTPTTAAASGRSTAGSAGAGCAPPGLRRGRRAGARGRPATRSIAAGPRARALRRGASTANWSRCRPPTACRRGRSARAGRSSSTGTGADSSTQAGTTRQSV